MACVKAEAESGLEKDPMIPDDSSTKTEAWFLRSEFTLPHFKWLRIICMCMSVHMAVMYSYGTQCACVCTCLPCMRVGLHISLYTVCSSDHGGQKRTSNPLELELQPAVSYHVGARN